MKPKYQHYIVCLFTFKHKYFLLWRDGVNQPDEYVTIPDSANLLLSSSEKELLEKANEYGLSVVSQSPAKINLDRAFKVLILLRSDRPCSQKICKLLLDAWNVLEDMARSIRFNIGELNLEENNTLNKIYDKLFYGNNLPSVTPPNQTFSPIFSSVEIAVMLKYLQNLLNETLKP